MDHSHSHSHAHSHAHSHSHSHAHGEHPEPENTYFLDQICTIVVGGLIGFTAIALYNKGWLQSKFLLNERFHIPVLVAGIVLVALVTIRAAVLWKQAGAQGAKADEHAGHGHSHGDGGHDHGWAPWQYAVLIIPSVLFFLELPRDGFNMSRLNSDLRDVKLEAGQREKRLALAELAGSMVLPALRKGDPPVRLRFSELNELKLRQRSRDDFDGRQVILEGYFKRIEGTDNEFQLFRVMVNCCGTDSVTLRSLIVAPEPLQGFQYMDWVEIKGELTFQKIAGGNGAWMPVIDIGSMKDIIKKQPPADTTKDV